MGMDGWACVEAVTSICIGFKVIFFKNCTGIGKGGGLWACKRVVLFIAAVDLVNHYSEELGVNRRCLEISLYVHFAS